MPPRRSKTKKGSNDRVSPQKRATATTAPRKGICATYAFTVSGNQEEPDGSPLGYNRTTQASKWNAPSRKYEDWKNFVVGAFLRANPQVKPTSWKPLTLEKEQTARVSLVVHWHNGIHADLDNVLKGVLDALFTNDKNVDWLKAEGEMAKDGKGRMEVVVLIIRSEN